MPQKDFSELKIDFGELAEPIKIQLTMQGFLFNQRAIDYWQKLSRVNLMFHSIGWLDDLQYNDLTQQLLEAITEHVQKYELSSQKTT